MNESYETNIKHGYNLMVELWFVKLGAQISKAGA